MSIIIKKNRKQSIKSIILAIEENNYLTVSQIAHHINTYREAIHRRSDFEEIRNALDRNKTVIVNQIDTKLLERINSKDATASDFKLAYLRFGDNETRESVKENSVVQIQQNFVTEKSIFE